MCLLIKVEAMCKGLGGTGKRKATKLNRWACQEVECGRGLQCLDVSHLVQVPDLHCPVQRGTKQLVGATLESQTLREREREVCMDQVTWIR